MNQALCTRLITPQPFLVLLVNLPPTGKTQRADCLAPMGNKRLSQGHHDALLVQESNRESGTSDNQMLYQTSYCRRFSYANDSCSSIASNIFRDAGTGTVVIFRREEHRVEGWSANLRILQ